MKTRNIILAAAVAILAAASCKQQEQKSPIGLITEPTPASTNVNGKEYPKMMVARKGQKFPFIVVDEETGWYWIDTVKGRGCITGKPKYTALVVEEG